jgi:uncharacterized membrane protein
LERRKRERGELQSELDAAVIRQDVGASFMKTAETASTSCDASKRPVVPVKSESIVIATESVIEAKAEMGRSAAGAVISPNGDGDSEGAILSPELSLSKASGSRAEVVESAEPQDWFSKVAVWVGGIALLMAGFYMIKYSIDSGWMTPVVRLCLTTGFGALLCAVGFVIGIKSTMIANERIGQALSGAGIACLYFAAYAAVHMYGFLSPGMGFSAMLAVTVLAVTLSLKNGAPIAMMGLVGGFLTPWLMSAGLNDTVMLFSYLFLVF